MDEALFPLWDMTKGDGCLMNIVGYEKPIRHPRRSSAGIHQKKTTAKIDD
jgi:hypothetical protein